MKLLGGFEIKEFKFTKEEINELSEFILNEFFKKDSNINVNKLVPKMNDALTNLFNSAEDSYYDYFHEFYSECEGIEDVLVLPYIYTKIDYNEMVSLFDCEEYIEKFIIKKMNIDIEADNNYAVRRASKDGYIFTVKYLVSLGADITADNNYALRLASENGHLEVVEYLVSLGEQTLIK